MMVTPLSFNPIAGERTEVHEPIAPEPPRPLFRVSGTAEPFPVKALGPNLAPVADAIADVTQASPAICANAVLATASLAVQGLWDVRLPTGQVRPLSIFLMTIAASGERKTSADKEALAGVRSREHELRLLYPEKAMQHRNEIDVYEAARTEAIKRTKGDLQATRRALDELGPEPRAPKRPVLLVSEPTVEGLIKLLAESHNTMGLFSSEGGSFLGGHAMADEAKLRSAARLSSLWDGDVIDRVRSAGEASVLVGRRLALHVMAQPEAAVRFLADSVLRDQGLLSRILVAAPAPTAGTRAFRDPSADSGPRISRFATKVQDLCRSLDRTPSEEQVLPAIELDADARALFIEWHDEVEWELTTRFATIRGLASKLPEHAVRIAAVISAFANNPAGRIAGEDMANGIRLSNFYAGEALRLYDGARVPERLRSAERLRIWLEQRPDDLVCLSEVYQRGPGDLRDKSSAMNGMQVLEDHGWVKRIDGGGMIDGRHRREVWRIMRDH